MSDDELSEDDLQRMYRVAELTRNDDATWNQLSCWEAKTVLMLMLSDCLLRRTRSVSGASVRDLPSEIVARGMDELLRCEVVFPTASGYVLIKFLPAMEVS